MRRFALYPSILILLLCCVGVVAAQTATPTPSYLTSGIYNQNNSNITISGNYTALYDTWYYLSDAFSFPSVYYSGDVTSGGSAIGNMTASDGLSAAFDNNAATRASIASTTGIIGYDFGASNSKTIGRYTIQHYSGVATSQAPQDWILQSSDDNSSWSTRDTRSGETFTSGQIKTYTIATPTTARYWRLNISNNGGAANTSVAEIEFMTVSANTPFVSFYFIGDEFSLLSTQSPNAPELQVCIDSFCSNVSQYNNTTISGISATFDNLINTSHYVTITKLTSGGTNDFIFDGIIIAPQFEEQSPSDISISVTLEAPPTDAFHNVYTVENSEATPQVVSFDYSVNSGDVMTGGLLFVQVLLMLSAFLLWIFKREEK